MERRERWKPEDQDLSSGELIDTSPAAIEPYPRQSKLHISLEIDTPQMAYFPWEHLGRRPSSLC